MAKTIRTFQMRVKGIGERNTGFEAMVSVEIDFAAIADKLGARAVRSKGHKAVEAGGLVVVRATDVRILPAGI